ncbi:hypothetical protein IQ244_20295 [Nostoc sp. LEGE 06077]|uniref:hypothetical protein n=1 Tax=Nostoc sp. LEGE 06077 TaxID=915325 RepID=UPI00187E8CAA|nr:hypothetical protein [Nostoc sp. LEGE 06077]MBE9208840.1 hypothetical protein [Nostoc sp. LEGE 06077]
MLSSLKDSLDVLLSVAALIGIIFHIAKTKADIEKSIDDVKDQLSKELMNLNTDIKVSRAQQEGKKEMVEYFINDLYYQIHHKFYRAWDEIKELQAFLQDQGFVARVKPQVPPAPKKIKIDEI